ncbi:MAG: hypothetical protein IIB37_05295 [Gemmatimonadetes bacterium]|nr:hypothetical protein [Gemmatimonadota bacterium]
MNDRATTLLQGRREKLEHALGRPLALPEPATGPELSESEQDHLRNAATDLYLNELAWENITEEEQVEGEPLAELAFPGFLAFIQGLLLEKVMPDSLAPANPRPEIVEDLVQFLAQRVVALQDEMGGGGEGDAEQEARDLALTDRLLDVVLFRLHGVDPADAEGFRDSAPAS